MKKQNIFLFIAIFIAVNSFSLYAQAQWALTGNLTTNPSTNFVGTTDNADLVFRTNNTEKVRIQSGGNVGIGTTSPGNLLHLYNSGTGAALYSQWSNGNATHTSGMIVGINGSNEGLMNMQDNRPINFLTNNMRRGRITSGGNFHRAGASLWLGARPRGADSDNYRKETYLL